MGMTDFFNPGYQQAMDQATDDEFLTELLKLVELLQGDGVPTLYHPWILRRLRLIKQRAAHLYYGAFLVPLRQLAPRQINHWDLVDAMAQVDGWVEGKLGTMSQEAWGKDMDALYDQGLPTGLSTGWPAVDQHYRVMPGWVTILTGVPSHGKSRWLHNLCVHLAQQHDWRISLFSPEHAPVGLLGAQLIELALGMPLHGRDGKLAPADWYQGRKWVAEHFQVIDVHDPLTPTLGALLQIARQHVGEWGMQGLVLDPWNEIDHQYGAREREDQYVSRALSQIRRFARTHNVHVWLVAHPTKLHKALSGPYEGKYPPPTPYDISGAAHWYNKGDACLCVWRDIEMESQSNAVELHVQKVRSRAVGKPGLVDLTYTGLAYRDRTF